ncbi:MAG: hypothetical protein KDK30_07530 [Leptospiraceae bacterium]|nr:hypothetical protein [Leptospiraceae bacterium]
MSAENGQNTQPPRKTLRQKIRYWMSVAPGTRRDYILTFLALIDVLLLMFRSTFEGLFPAQISAVFIAFDFGVLTIWGIDFLLRLRRSPDKLDFATSHWYEIVGLIPLATLRMFLLLRAAKLAIAYYKLGRSEQKVSRLLTQEITFRFRDVIVDTIADAVFEKSLDRVEEVMLSLDYQKLAHTIVDHHEKEIKSVIIDTLRRKSFMGELSLIPFMGPVMNRLGGDVADTVIEVMEQEVMGDVFKEITARILNDMHIRLRQLDVERITTGSAFVRKQKSPENPVESSSSSTDENEDGSDF